MADSREFDVVLWGATGFAGTLTAEYLADAYGTDRLDWAIAGRNEAKLEQLREDLRERYGELEGLGLVVGDAFDRDSLEAMAERTDVVCTTVGPYADFGTELVAACLDRETDYCDLTGEVQWMRETIEGHHDEARERGVRLVHTCGFDSIPSDLGAWMVQKRAREQYGVPCEKIAFGVATVSGGLSGGTLASMANTFEAASEDPELRRTLAAPYSLNPPGQRDGPDRPPQSGVRYDEQLEAWTGPFVMATVNEKVVRRTNALLDFPYGRQFQYRESTICGAGVSGAIKAAGLTAGVGAFAGAMALGPTRSLLQATILPEPGEGPSRESIENGHFTVKLVGTGTDASGEPFRVDAEVGADRDPGYGATATMLGESAVCLADDPVDEGLSGGVLTPASAMGTRLIERLRRAGMRWQVD